VTGPKTNERPGTRARLRSVPVSAFKVREVLDLIRGEEVGRAAEILEFCERGAAEVRTLPMIPAASRSVPFRISAARCTSSPRMRSRTWRALEADIPQ